MTAPASGYLSFAEESPAVTLAPSPRQVECLRAYAEVGDQRQAAQRVGVTYETYKNYMTRAYRRLGVSSAVSAFRVLGWLESA